MSLETPTKIRMLQRKLYQKAREEPNYRFYLLYDKVYREDTLSHAYELAKSNQGAPGVDGRFTGIEAAGLEEWLNVIRSDLRQRPIHHKPVKRVEIPKPGGSERPLGFRPYGIGWYRPPQCWCWNRCLKRTSIRMPMAIGRNGARRTRSGECRNYSGKATPMWWTPICPNTSI
jgi:hypothetical protein